MWKFRHLSLPPIFNGIRVARSYWFLCSILSIFVYRFVLFLLAIVLPVLLWIKVSNYPFWPLYCLSFFELRFLITPLATFLKIYLYTFQTTFFVFGLFVLKLLSIFNFLTFWPKYYCTETSYQYIHYWPDTNLSIYNWYITCILLIIIGLLNHNYTKKIE